MRIETIGIICRGDYILLGLKKIKFGKGKYNGFGGGVKRNESLEQAVIRETREESGINIINPELVGKILFKFDSKEQDHLVNFFRITEYKGFPEESDEMIPRWFCANNLPYEKMWEDDKYWFPMLLDKKKFIGMFYYDKENKIRSYGLEEDKDKNLCADSLKSEILSAMRHGKHINK